MLNTFGYSSGVKRCQGLSTREKVYEKDDEWRTEPKRATPHTYRVIHCLLDLLSSTIAF